MDNLHVDQTNKAREICVLQPKWTRKNTVVIYGILWQAEVTVKSDYNPPIPQMEKSHIWNWTLFPWDFLLSYIYSRSGKRPHLFVRPFSISDFLLPYTWSSNGKRPYPVRGPFSIGIFLSGQTQSSNTKRPHQVIRPFSKGDFYHYRLNFPV